MEPLNIQKVCEILEVEVNRVINDAVDGCTYTAVVSNKASTMFLKVTTYGDVGREVSMMQRAASVVPVPTVFYSGKVGDIGYILMEYVADSISMEEYVGTLSDNVYEQLTDYVSKIRSCVAPGPFGDSCDHYLAICHSENSVYMNCNEFMKNRLIGVGIAHEPIPDLSGAKLVLSHCDLWPRNVMVSTDGTKVTSIVDWETAGYYPEHYEHSIYVYSCHFEGYKYGPELHAWLAMFESSFTPTVALLERKIYKKVVERWS